MILSPTLSQEKKDIFRMIRLKIYIPLPFLRKLPKGGLQQTARKPRKRKSWDAGRRRDPKRREPKGNLGVLVKEDPRVQAVPHKQSLF